MTIIHITNINNNTKKYLIDKFSNKEKIKLIDLDDLNYKYLSEIISFNEYKISFKQKGIKTKQLEKDYIYKFKDDIFDYFENINNDDLFYIIMGYNILFCNMTSICYYDFYFKICIEYDDSDTSIKNIIKNNLNLYYDDIINGYVPVTFLNYNDINKKFDKYIDLLKNENYIFIKNIDEIIKIINKKISIENPNILYILSFDSYDSVINDNIIYAFSEIWIGISFLFSKNITKGYKNNKPYIYDPSDSLINNKKDIFIYEIIDTNNFIPIVNNEYIYKYYTYNQSYFNNKNIINNVYKYL